MDTFQELDVTVVYSEGGSPARRATRVAAPGRLGTRRVMGCLSLLAAAGWFYATWFPVRHFIEGNHLRVMIGLPDLVDLSQLFGGFLPPPAQSGQPDETDGQVSSHPRPGVSAKGGVSVPQSERAEKSQSIVKHLQGAKYVWLATMTMVGCWLAMTGAAGVSGWLVGVSQTRPSRLFAIAALLAAALLTWRYWPRPAADVSDFPTVVQFVYAACFAVLAGALCASSSRGGAVRLFILGLIAVLALGIGAAYWLWYGTGFPIRAAQTYWLVVMVVVAFAGAAFLSNRIRGLSALAIVLILLSCGVTAAGMWHIHRIGGFADFTPTTTIYVMVLGVQSLFAWVLLGARRALR